MPSSSRQFEVGGIYHIINRGYDKRTIFLDESDYNRFEKSLFYFNNQALIKIRELLPTGQTGGVDREPLVEILAFVLMPNHYHLIIREITSRGVSRFMQKLSNGYTGYFNTKYKRIGFGGLFQARYKSVTVKDDNDLLVKFVYVHTNPVEIIEPLWKKEWKVENPKRALDWMESYKWSSYRDYVGGRVFSKVVQTTFYNEFFNKDKKQIKKVVEDWVYFKAEKTLPRV